MNRPTRAPPKGATILARKSKRPPQPVRRDERASKGGELQRRAVQRLKSWREENHLTQAEMADLCKWTRSRLALFEQGRRNLGLDEIETLCAATGVTVSQFLDEETARPLDEPLAAHEGFIGSRDLSKRPGVDGDTEVQEGDECPADTLASRLRGLMAAALGRRVTQAELAEAVGTTQQTIGHICSGRTKDIGGRLLLDIADFFNVSPRHLLQGGEQQPEADDGETPPEAGADAAPTTLAERFAIARKCTGLTRSEFAKVLGLSHAAVFKIEDGGTKALEHQTAVRAARLSGTSPEWLAGAGGATDHPPPDVDEGYAVHVLFGSQPDQPPKALAVVDSVTNGKSPDLMRGLISAHQMAGVFESVRAIAITVNVGAVDALLAADRPVIHGALSPD